MPTEVDLSLALPFEPTITTTLASNELFKLDRLVVELQRQEPNAGAWTGVERKEGAPRCLGRTQSVFTLPPFRQSVACAGQKFRFCFLSLAKRVSASDTDLVTVDEMATNDALSDAFIDGFFAEPDAAPGSGASAGTSYRGETFLSSEFTCAEPARFVLSDGSAATAPLVRVADEVHCFGMTNGQIRNAGEVGGRKEPLVIKVRLQPGVGTRCLRVVGWVADADLPNGLLNPSLAPKAVATLESVGPDGQGGHVAKFHFGRKGRAATTSIFQLPAPKAAKVSYTNQRFCITFNLEHNADPDGAGGAWRPIETRHSNTLKAVSPQTGDKRAAELSLAKKALNHLTTERRVASQRSEELEKAMVWLKAYIGEEDGRPTSRQAGTSAHPAIPFAGNGGHRSQPPNTLPPSDDYEVCTFRSLSAQPVAPQPAYRSLSAQPVAEQPAFRSLSAQPAAAQPAFRSLTAQPAAAQPAFRSLSAQPAAESTALPTHEELAAERAAIAAELPFELQDMWARLDMVLLHDGASSADWAAESDEM